MLKTVRSASVVFRSSAEKHSAGLMRVLRAEMDERSAQGRVTVQVGCEVEVGVSCSAVELPSESSTQHMAIYKERMAHSLS